MPTIYFTYVWDDNTSSDVDFIAQELVRAGLQIKLDQWNIRAGRRLWEQIESFIQEGKGADAWLFFATQNSLGSEACKKEVSFALGRAIDRRGEDFPVIALFPGSVDSSITPVRPGTPLQVSLADLEWKERIAAAAENRGRSSSRPQIEAFTLQLYQDASRGDHRLTIEVRPRAGTWSPFFAAIPLSERGRVQPHIMHGPRGRVPKEAALAGASESPSIDETWWVMYAQNEATPTHSYFIRCSERPTRVAFGVRSGRPQFIVGDLQLYPSQSLLS